jgi:hypothetical protein
LIRNYFDAWQVEERECGEVLVDEEGINALTEKLSFLEKRAFLTWLSFCFAETYENLTLRSFRFQG